MNAVVAAKTQGKRRRHPLTRVTVVTAMIGSVAGAVGILSVLVLVIQVFTTGSCWHFEPHCTGLLGDILAVTAPAGIWIGAICLFLLVPTLLAARWLQRRQARKAAPEMWKVCAGASGVAIGILLVAASIAWHFGWI